MKLLSTLVVLCATLVASTQEQHTSQGPRNVILHSREAKLPTCALQCTKSLATKYGCEITDVDCLCTNADLTNAVAGCVATECTVIEALASQKHQTLACGAPIRNQGQLTRRTLWGLCSVSILAIALRFVARSPALSNGPGYGWDDWTMLLVLALLIPHEVGLEIMIQNGLGQDLWMLSPSQITTIMKFFWMGECYYTGVVMFTKVAILLLYVRIFPDTVSTWFRITCFMMITACIAGAIGMVLAVVFECNPVAGAYKRWDGLHPAKCIDTNAQVIAMAGINIALDLIVFFLPIPKIIRLNISVQKKIGVCMTFLVGLFVTVVSIVRLEALVKHISTSNPTWDLNPIGIWSQAEVNVGILVTCMPCFARLIRQFWTSTVSNYISNVSGRIGSLSKSKHSQQRDQRGHVVFEGELRPLPSHDLPKKVHSSVVYNGRLDSSDELQLMETRSDGSIASHWGQNKHDRDFN